MDIRDTLMQRLFLFLLLISFGVQDVLADTNLFKLTTSTFLDAGELPVLYTCDDKDISPELHWDHIPTQAQSLALLVTDPDAPGGTFYHWILYNIPTNINSLSENIQNLPTSVLVGKNDFGNLHYSGPCPPKGSSHTYIFTLYALNSKINLPAGASGPSVLKEIEPHIIAKTSISAVYTRWMK